MMMDVAGNGPQFSAAYVLNLMEDFNGTLGFQNGVLLPLIFVSRWLAVGLDVLVMVMWLVPDRRIEDSLRGQVGMGRD